MSAPSAEHDLSGEERAGLELVRETGGLYQSELWKRLDVSSRVGSRIVDRLLEGDLVQRREAVHRGSRTYFLSPAARDLDFSLLMAGDLISPFIDEEELEPTSDAFSHWVMRLAREPSA